MIMIKNSEERIFIQIWILTENSGESGKSGNFWHHNQRRIFGYMGGGGGSRRM